MRLSELSFSLLEPDAQKALSDPYALHQTLMTAFPSQAGRVLFRIEPLKKCDPPDRGLVLVQSRDEPHWSDARLPAGTLVNGPKDFEPSFQAGQALRFRLRANPTVKKKRPETANGRRLGVIGEQAQRDWLHKKGGPAGFNPDHFIVIDEGMTVGRKQNHGHRLAFLSVRYEGRLTVTNPESLAQVISQGIGSAKAFGFGLLSLARA